MQTGMGTERTVVYGGDAASAVDNVGSDFDDSHDCCYSLRFLGQPHYYDGCQPYHICHHDVLNSWKDTYILILLWLTHATCICIVYVYNDRHKEDLPSVTVISNIMVTWGLEGSLW